MARKGTVEIGLNVVDDDLSKLRWEAGPSSWFGLVGRHCDDLSTVLGWEEGLMPKLMGGQTFRVKYNGCLNFPEKLSPPPKRWRLGGRRHGGSFEPQWQA